MPHPRCFSFHCSFLFYQNHGGSDVSGIDETIQDPKPANLECVEIPDSDDEWHYVAVADVQPNEELLCDYAKFHVYGHKVCC